MTIFFGDIASYQAGLNLSGWPFVWVKATEGTSYFNPTYAGFKSQAASKGIKFGAYHALHNGNGAAQADYCFSKVGAGVPVMLDWENFGDNPSVQTAIDFITRLRARGGSIKAVYLPKWFWEGNLGSPSLSWFPANGCLLVSSNYTNYSDSGPGWAAYGGWSPTQWQYSSTYSFNGQSVDINAYRGTIDQWWALLTGSQEDDFLSALTNAEQEELLTIARKMGAADPTYNSTKIVQAATAQAKAATDAATAATAAANAVGAVVQEIKADVEALATKVAEPAPAPTIDYAQLAVALLQAIRNGN
jgi:hypothetical protein